MKSKFILGIVVVIVLTSGITYYSGNLTGRWGAFRGQEEAISNLKKLPLEIGDWVADKEETLDNGSIAMLQIQNSYIFRSYRNTVTQSVVHLTIMVGRTGRVTVHTPDICFGGKDYIKEDTRSAVPFDVELQDVGKRLADKFWRVDFVGKSLDTNNRISFYYGIFVGDVWTAVENPRVAFQKFRYAYKLQAQAFTAGAGADTDIVKDFLSECLPVIHKHLRPCN
jgi:hypothetical protein